MTPTTEKAVIDCNRFDFGDDEQEKQHFALHFRNGRTFIFSVAKREYKQISHTLAQLMQSPKVPERRLVLVFNDETVVDIDQVAACWPVDEPPDLDFGDDGEFGYPCWQ